MIMHKKKALNTSSLGQNHAFRLIAANINNLKEYIILRSNKYKVYKTNSVKSMLIVAPCVFQIDHLPHLNIVLLCHICIQPRHKSAFGVDRRYFFQSVGSDGINHWSFSI